MKKIVFLSDAHLDGKNDRALPWLMSFIKSLKGKISSLYIVGDLFDFWMGDNPLCLIEYRPLLEALRELKDEGAEIVYIEGNHDFFLGRFFTDVLRARVFPKECVEYINGKRVYIAHGDLADTGDYGYRIFRALIHNRGAFLLSRILPPSFVWRVARLFSLKSRTNRRSENPRLSNAFHRFTEGKFAEGYDVVILGHLHVPEIREVIYNGKPHVSMTLGGWLAGRSYLEYDKGRFVLRQWKRRKSHSRQRTSS